MIVTFAVSVMVSCGNKRRYQEQQEKDENCFFADGKMLQHSGLLSGLVLVSLYHVQIIT